jgi:ABC-type phosphate/phosphonate transport system substrate-binding protein
MHRRAFLGVCGVGLLGVARGLASAQGSLPVKVGLSSTIFPGMSEVLLAAAARPFRSLLESATGVSGQIVQGGDARVLAKKLEEDRVQLGVFQGIEYAWARVHNPKLEPIVICCNEEQTLKAYLIVKASSKYKAPADLQSKVLTMAPETREHCKVFLERRCVPASTAPKKFFKKLAVADDVEEALDDVVDGKAAAALIDGLPWSSYRKSKPGCARALRVLEASEPFPCGVIACQAGKFDAAQLQRFRGGLMSAKDTSRGKQLLKFLRISGFEPMPGSYEQLLTSIVKAYPPSAK